MLKKIKTKEFNTGANKIVKNTTAPIKKNSCSIKATTAPIKVVFSSLSEIFKVIIDKKDGEYYIGRTEFDSPEVDPEVLIKDDRELNIGDFYSVEIIGAEPFDLYGVVV